jgi:thiol:disulfide interchange protein DsbA
MGVAGRWYTDGTLASNNPRMLQVVDYLIGQARKK